MTLSLVLVAAIAAVGVTYQSRGEKNETGQRPRPALSPGGPTDATNGSRPGPNGIAVAVGSSVAPPLDQSAPVEASSNDAELASSAATVLWSVELSPFESRPPATIDPGTLLTVLAHYGGRATVQRPDGTEGYVAACALSSDGSELAIARALLGSQDGKEAARQGYSAASLAPLLDGKPPRAPQCAPPS